MKIKIVFSSINRAAICLLILLLLNNLHAQTVNLVYEDTLILPSFTEFDLPVKLKTGAGISAMSLGFYYPQDLLEISGLELAAGFQGYNYNITDSSIIMVWSAINPVTIPDNDTLLTLKMKTMELSGLTGTIKLDIYELSEFADGSANIIEGIVLEMPEIRYLEPDIDDSLGQNYVRVFPNPFDDFITINFYLEEESRVKISLCNPAGVEVKHEESIYPEGTHREVLYAADFAKGIYLLKFEIATQDSNYAKMFKILNTGR